MKPDREAKRRKGYCQCGCGEKTAIAQQTKASRGDVAGEPVKYIKGHRSRRHDPQYEVDHETGCWAWAWKTSHGYGVLRAVLDDGRVTTRQAHRVYYERVHGPLARGLHLHHECRNRACVNPAHLRPLTPTEHIRLSAHTKLTHEAATAIRGLVEQGWLRVDVAAAFGITAQHVTTIVKRKAWA